MTTPTQPTRDYRNLFMDSTRWRAFVPRDDDIIICTPYKSGTTWTQMICALLIFGTPELPRPLAELSPWLDMRVVPLDDVIAGYEAQAHRRFIKTHTALDGLPHYAHVTYLFCARDPRDVFISMWHHAQNQRLDHLIGMLQAQGIEVPPRPPLPDDIDERFRLWATRGAFPWESDGFPYWSVFSHAKTFWDRRHEPNIHLLHYADLKADLCGQMRRIAGILGIDIDETQWPALVEAAGFDAMKANADRTAPDTDFAAWHDNSAFFHRGEHGQWREMLSADSVALYEALRERQDDDAFVRWLETGGAVPA